MAAPSTMWSRCQSETQQASSYQSICASGAGFDWQLPNTGTAAKAAKACCIIAKDRAGAQGQGNRGPLNKKAEARSHAFVRRAALISLGCSVITLNSTTTYRRRPRPLRRGLSLSAPSINRQQIACMDDQLRITTSAPAPTPNSPACQHLRRQIPMSSTQAFAHPPCPR